MMEHEMELPEGWEWKSLRDICKDVTDGDHLPPPKTKVGVPFITISNVNKQSRNIDFNNTFTVSEEYYRNLKPNRKPQIGDVLYTVTGSFGIPVLVDFDLEFCFQRHIGLIRPLPGVSQKWLYFLLQSPFIFTQAEASATGTAQKTVGLSSLRNFQIPFCSATEQERIVAKIEQLFSELEKGKAQILLAQQQLKTYRQAVLKWAFEGRLTNADVVDGELPGGWEWKAVDSIASVGTGATPLKSNKGFYENGKIAWVTSGALNDEYVSAATDFVTEKAITETNLSVYPKGTLLLAMYGEGKTRGKCSELTIEASTNQAIAAIYFDRHDARIKPFLKYFLLKNYQDIRRESSGGVQPNLNLGIVKKTLIPVAPPEEQHRIVQEIESRLSVCDAMEATLQASLAQAEQLRQSILKRAFEGRLV